MPSLESTAIAAGAAAALGLVAGGIAYAARWPTSQLFGPTLVDVPDPDASDPDHKHHTLALTYDDGPSDRNTPALLDLLAGANVTATFFLIGNHVRRHPQLARRIAEGGHTLGNHTDMHPDLARKDANRIRAELELCQRTLADIAGITPTLFRPPYGSRSPAVLRIARELGLTPVLWNITAQDWKPIGSAAILKRIDAGIARNRRRGRTSNLLLHDASHLDGNTPRSRADTLAITANLLQRQGLRFVSVAGFASWPPKPKQLGGR